MNELNHGPGKGDKDRSPNWRKNYDEIQGFGHTTGFRKFSMGSRKVYRTAPATTIPIEPIEIDRPKLDIIETIAQVFGAPPVEVGGVHEREGCPGCGCGKLHCDTELPPVSPPENSIAVDFRPRGDQGGIRPT